MTVFAKSTEVLEVQHLQAGQGMEERPLALGTFGFWTFFFGGRFEQQRRRWIWKFIEEFIQRKKTACFCCFKRILLKLCQWQSFLFWLFIDGLPWKLEWMAFRPANLRCFNPLESENVRISRSFCVFARRFLSQRKKHHHVFFFKCAGFIPSLFVDISSKTVNKWIMPVVFMKSFVGYLDLGRTRTWPAFLSCPEVMARYSGTELLVMVGKSVLEGGGEGKMTAFMWWLLGWMWHSPWVPNG